jgi:hypothetical protein
LIQIKKTKQNEIKDSDISAIKRADKPASFLLCDQSILTNKTSPLVLIFNKYLSEKWINYKTKECTLKYQNPTCYSSTSNSKLAILATYVNLYSVCLNIY